MGLRLGPCPCPALEVTVVSLGVDSIQVTINDGGPATVRVGPIDGTFFEQTGDGPFTFTDLKASTQYQVFVESECGSTFTTIISTDDCPDVTATFASTTDTLSVTVTGGAPADVVVNGVTKRADANGSAVTFVGLTPDTSYTATVTSECGNDAIFEFSTQPCPAITATFTSTTDTLTVTVTGGAPADVVANGVTKRADANGNVLVFSGLKPDTKYTATITSACGNDAIFEFATQPCPVIAATSTSTTDTLTVTVTGGAPATVTANGQTRPVAANGGSVTFPGLLANAEYVVQVESACGNSEIFAFSTQPCPVITITNTSTTDTLSVTVTGGAPAAVTVNGETRQADANGDTVTFPGLTPDTEYVIAVESNCGIADRFEFSTQPCPVIAATFASTPNTLSVTVTGGAPADVTVNGVTKRADANGEVVAFAGLLPETVYTVTIVSACGINDIFEFATQPCPAVTATFASTTDTLTVTVTGGAPALVTLGDEVRPVKVNGGTAEFKGLSPDTEYVIRVESDCGNFELLEFSTQACPALVLVQSAETPDSITVQVTGGAPAVVTLNGSTKRFLANGDSATWTGLKADTQYAVVGVSDCNGTCGNPCAENTLLEGETPICPVITFTVSAINFEGFTVTVNTGGPVDFVVYDADNKVLDVAENVSASHTFDGFADGQRLRVEASSYCESVSRQFVLVPKVPVFCASRPMYKNGFGYVAGDVADPAATVVVRAEGSTQNINLYPSAREGATAPVLAPNGTILGFAVNRSDCSWDGCCQAEEYGAV